jgi:hypothetical protein
MKSYVHDNASLIVLERNTFLFSLSVVHFPLFEMAVKLLSENKIPHELSPFSEKKN